MSIAIVDYQREAKVTSWLRRIFISKWLEGKGHCESSISVGLFHFADLQVDDCSVTKPTNGHPSSGSKWYHKISSARRFRIFKPVFWPCAIAHGKGDDVTMFWNTTKKTGAAQPCSQRIHHNESVSGPSLVELWALPWETRAIRRSVDFPEWFL